METNDQKVTFLPNEKGENAVKIDLEQKFNLKKEDETENARAILFLPPDGYVKEHSHYEDSEIYINLTRITDGINHDASLKGLSLEKVLLIVKDYSCPNNIKQWFHELLKSSSKVAGNNSPTFDTKHSIPKSANPQVYLAIKKGPENKKWDQLESNTFEFFSNLNFDCKAKDNKLLIKSGKEQQEEVDINFNENIIAYKDKVMKNCVKVDIKNQVFNKIDISNENFKNAQQNLGIEM